MEKAFYRFFLAMFPAFQKDLEEADATGNHCEIIIAMQNSREVLIQNTVTQNYGG